MNGADVGDIQPELLGYWRIKIKDFCCTFPQGALPGKYTTLAGL
jgi:hypothetical protein